tara:strand:- start:558 stop:752 length:195 start_codon:yes stop_codon:yes gene_type:complete
MVMKDDFNYMLNPEEELVVRADKLEKFIELVKEIKIDCYSQEEYRDIINSLIMHIFGGDDGRNI